MVRLLNALQKRTWAADFSHFRSAWQTQALFLACLTICVIIPASIAYNIDIKAMLVVGTGLVSWVFVLLDWRAFLALLGKKQCFALALFIALAVTSSLVNHSRSLNLLGTPLVRLGAVEIVAAIGTGIWLLKVSARRLTAWLYAAIVVAAAATIPYSYYLYGGFGRPGGVYYQADILAITLGCGWFLGFEMLKLYRRHRVYLYCSQVLLLAVLLITQTRAAVAIVGLLSLAWWIYSGALRGKRLALAMIVLAAGLLLLASLAPSRFTNSRDAAQSTSYRFSLQSAGLQASRHKPILGYGPGNISKALSCSTLRAPALQQTCHSGYFFDSSHNIFLDRVLAFGWLAGIIFGTMVVGSILMSLRSRRITVFTLCTIAIALYYLTNVTNVELELLFWIVLLRAYAPAVAASTSR